MVAAYWLRAGASKPGSSSKPTDVRVTFQGGLHDQIPKIVLPAADADAEVAESDTRCRDRTRRCVVAVGRHQVAEAVPGDLAQHRAWWRSRLNRA